MMRPAGKEEGERKREKSKQTLKAATVGSLVILGFCSHEKQTKRGVEWVRALLGQLGLIIFLEAVPFYLVLGGKAFSKRGMVSSPKPCFFHIWRKGRGNHINEIDTNYTLGLCEDNKSDLDFALLHKPTKANWFTEREYNYSLEGETCLV